MVAKMTPDDILETLRRLLVNAVLGVLLAAVVAFGFMFAIDARYHYEDQWIKAGLPIAELIAHNGVPKDVESLGWTLGCLATLIYWCSPRRKRR
jgi:hypothetical protein